MNGPEFVLLPISDIELIEGNPREISKSDFKKLCNDIKNDPNFLKLYNEIILINVAGSLAIRVGRQFDSSRKVGKMHQNVLVFYKGDPKKIKENIPKLNLEKEMGDELLQPN